MCKIGTALTKMIRWHFGENAPIMKGSRPGLKPCGMRLVRGISRHAQRQKDEHLGDAPQP
eukprot:6457850-Amphidinium_carterae.1